MTFVLRSSFICMNKKKCIFINHINRILNHRFHTSKYTFHGEYEMQDPKTKADIASAEVNNVYFSPLALQMNDLRFLQNAISKKLTMMQEEKVNVTFIDKTGKKFAIKGKVGDNILYLAHRYGIEMEGACEASLACTTCHVYVHHDYINKLTVPEEKEEDLLDLAPFLKENSRLGCQIILSKEMDGIELQLPKATRNFYVDGHTPTSH